MKLDTKTLYALASLKPTLWGDARIHIIPKENEYWVKTDWCLIRVTQEIEGGSEQEPFSVTVDVMKAALNAKKETVATGYGSSHALHVEGNDLKKAYTEEWTYEERNFIQGNSLSFMGYGSPTFDMKQLDTVSALCKKLLGSKVERLAQTYPEGLMTNASNGEIHIHAVILGVNAPRFNNLR